MIALFSIILLVIAIFALPATFLLREQKCTTWWDFTYPFAGVAAWIILSAFDIGATMSLSNLAIEVFGIAVASIFLPWVLWFMSRLVKKQPKKLSFVFTLLPIIVAVIMRLTMPTLPE
jgi:hypothetical protein